ncbi:hypothetical protein L1049_005491 [Liquidambar formosana]|uniref:C2H2-type domain-containing protein n=1 Tax=Liquidambar formosana TaxID=63359 RepID=A0AAP0RQS8_LIQFO
MDDDQEYQLDMPLKLTTITTNGRLWIKLKIPNSSEFSGEEGIHDQPQSPTEKAEPSWVCKVCNKGFSSGKGLGGHMRIQLQPNKEGAALLNRTQYPVLKKHVHVADDDLNSKKPTSSLCGKDFPSMKSLFGHMRCHPEREWRGIQPPMSTSRNTSSSTLSDAIAQKQTDNHMDSVNKALGSVSVVDLSESLSGGSATCPERPEKNCLHRSCWQWF